jgi:hypothetical protein
MPQIIRARLLATAAVVKTYPGRRPAERKPFLALATLAVACVSFASALALLN